MIVNFYVFCVVMLEFWFLFFGNEIIVVDEIIIVVLEYFFVIIINEIFLFIGILLICFLLIFCIVDIVFGFKYVIVLV